MTNVAQSLEFDTLMNEEQLKRTARHVKDLVPKDENNISTEQIIKLHASFDSLFAVASAPALTAPHRVAAWNALCALIDQCVSSQNDVLIDWTWTCGIWDRALELYLSHSRNARPKSSKQLLVALTTASRKSGFLQDRGLSVAQRLIHGISSLDDLPLAKASILVLSQFLNKGLLSVENVLHPFAAHNQREISHFRDAQSLLSTVLNLVGRGDFNSAIGQAISTILDTFSYLNDDKATANDLEPIWIRSVRESIAAKAIDLDQLRIHILPVVFRRSLHDYVLFLHRLGVSDLAGKMSVAECEPNNIVFAAALRTGKELGMAQETQKLDIEETDDCVLVPYHVIETLFQHASRPLRLSGLSFLISAHSMTQPFPLRTLIMIRRHLPNFFADTDANLRGEVFSLLQSLMDRMRAITAVLARDVISKNSSTHLLNQHKSFLCWLLNFSGRELRPTASYQRHISALKTISIMCRSGLDPAVDESYLTKSASGPTKWPCHITVVSPDLRRLLLILLMDPFDDVRQASASILSICSDGLSANKFNILQDLEHAIPRAGHIMLRTGRADHADGVAHLTSLLYRYQGGVDMRVEALEQTRSKILPETISRLEQMLIAAHDNIVAAAKDSPLHGRITSLRYMVMQSSDEELVLVRSNIISCLSSIWELVKPVLCNDAPEGYQVDDTDELAEFSTKDTLSYCWRALKESSLLLGILVSNSSISTTELIYLSELCFEQLAELRHRGAFSTVAQSWITCCLRCAHVKQDNENLLLVWYKKIQQILGRKIMINTRRSAGIPSLLCGLLVADPTRQLMAMAFEDMSLMARMPVETASAQQSSLPQVHAMNCIKDVLKNTRLGELSERYVPKALRLAADSLRSDAWAIRNCGLMLFRAVIDRLLGTNDGRFDEDFSSAKRLTAESYPELLEISLTFIIPSSKSNSSSVATQFEGVFPALQLLQRIRLPKSTASDVIIALLKLTASPSWHIRDKAARTYAMVVDKTEISEELQRTLDLGTTRNQNALHGLLLCAKYLVEKSNSKSNSLRNNSTSSGSTAESVNAIQPAKRLLCTVLEKESLHHCNTCSFTRAAYIDLLTACMSGILRFLKDGLSWNLEDITDTIRPIFFDNGSLDILNELTKIMEQPEEVNQENSCVFNLRGASALRASLAQILPYTFVLLNYSQLLASSSGYLERVQSTIHLLAIEDPDAACVLFHTFQELSAVLLSNAVPTVTTILLRSAISILDQLHGSEVAYALGGTLLTYSSECPEFHGTVDRGVISQLLSLTNFSNLLQKGVTRDSLFSQHYADQSVQLRAFFLDILSKSSEPTVDLSEWVWTEELTDLILTCKSSINGASGLCSREAASQAISRFHFLWPLLRNSSVHPPLLVLLYHLTLSIYDLLNDDDEEIRLLAARTTSLLLSAQPSTSLEQRKLPENLDPLVAGDELINFMITTWSDDIEFATEAFQRAFGFIPPPACVPTISSNREDEGKEDKNILDDWSIHARLRRATRFDTALFAAEKSNLYIDEAREARVWSRVVSRLDLSQKPTTLLIARLATWVVDGWGVFREYLTASITSGNDNEVIHLDDGGGDNTSRAEIFTLSLQLIYATDLLLDIVDKRQEREGLRSTGDTGQSGLPSKFPFRPSEVRRAVEEFYMAYLQSDAKVNVIWRWEVERVFARVAQQALMLAKGRADAMHSGIERE